MKWPWQRPEGRPDVDQRLDESIARLEQAIQELRQTTQEIRRERDRP